MTEGHERRAHPRVRSRRTMRVEITAAPALPELDGSTYSCSTKNVSVGGLHFQLRRDVPVGTRLLLHVEGPNPGDAFNLQGRVVWARRDKKGRRCSIGIFFENVPPPTLNAWRRMVQGANP